MVLRRRRGSAVMAVTGLHDRGGGREGSAVSTGEIVVAWHGAHPPPLTNLANDLFEQSQRNGSESEGEGEGEGVWPIVRPEPVGKAVRRSGWGTTETALRIGAVVPTGQGAGKSNKPG